MKNLIYISILLLLASLVSCASSTTESKSDKDNTTKRQVFNTRSRLNLN